MHTQDQIFIVIEKLMIEIHYPNLLLIPLC